MSARKISRIIPTNRNSIAVQGVPGNLNVRAQDINPIIDRINDLDTIEKSGTDNYIITESTGITKNCVGLIYTQTSSVTVGNTVTETSLLTSTTTFPANFFTVNKQILLRLRGFASRLNVHDIRIKVKLNSTVILDTGVSGGGAWTNRYFDTDGVIACRSTGTSGTLMGQGFTLVYNDHFGMVNTSPVTIDTTIAQTLDITCTWGTADAGDTITATNGFIEILK